MVKKTCLLTRNYSHTIVCPALPKNIAIKIFLIFIQNCSLTLFRAAAEIEPYHEVMQFFDLVTL